MAKKQVTVILKDHYITRYWERVGRAPPRAQRAWLVSSLCSGRAKRQKDGKFKVKLRGSRHQAVLAREHDTWVAITVE
ncbi:MAG: hypothetical protein ACUVSK_13855 [Desulfotomaculales bacterium]